MNEEGVRANERQHPLDLYAMRDQLRGGPIEPKPIERVPFFVGLYNSMLILGALACLAGGVYLVVTW